MHGGPGSRQQDASLAPKASVMDSVRVRHIVASIAAVSFFIICIYFAVQNLQSNLHVVPRASLSEYSWAELKLIATQIEASASDEEGIEIAKHYNLADSFGNADTTNVKLMHMKNGNVYKVNIVGILRDMRADGSGKAGITFILTGYKELHVMNLQNTNSGGWAACGLRGMINGDFRSYLREQNEDVRFVNYQVLVDNTDTEDGEQVNDYMWLYSSLEYPKETSLPGKKEYWLRSPALESNSSFDTVSPEGVFGDAKARKKLRIAPLFAF